jgi:Cu/Ag efflux pump CusA
MKNGIVIGTHVIAISYSPILHFTAVVITLWIPLRETGSWISLIDFLGFLNSLTNLESAPWIVVKKIVQLDHVRTD